MRNAANPRQRRKSVGNEHRVIRLSHQHLLFDIRFVQLGSLCFFVVLVCVDPVISKRVNVM